MNARQNRVQLLPPEGTGSSSLVRDPESVFYDLLKPARVKCYYGGRGSAKSWSVAEALISRASTSTVRILCTREFQSSIADSVHQLLKIQIERMGLSSWFTVTKTSIKSRTGSEFLFKGLAHHSAEIKSLEGIDICWVEEGNRTSQVSLDYLMPTIRKEGSEVWITFNPENEDDPAYQRFVKNPDPSWIVHKVNFDKNPHFSKTLEAERQYYIRQIMEADNEAERKQAQSNYDHIWLGMFRKIDDSIVLSGKCTSEDFDEDLWKTASRLYFGADFGFAQDAATLIRFFILNNILYVDHESYGVGVELEEMKEFYNSIPEAGKWPIKADCSRPETISYLKRQGFRIEGAAKWAGSVEDGLAHLRGFKRIVIHPRCKHTWDESKTYAYKRDSRTSEVLPILIDKNNHCIDAIRYGLDGVIQRRGSLDTWAKLAK